MADVSVANGVSVLLFFFFFFQTHTRENLNQVESSRQPRADSDPCWNSDVSPRLSGNTSVGGMVLGCVRRWRGEAELTHWLLIAEVQQPKRELAVFITSQNKTTHTHTHTHMRAFFSPFAL